MLLDPQEIVALLSRRLIFRPSDAVVSGSPANPGTVEPGDIIEMMYDGIGTLSNTVIEADE